MKKPIPVGYEDIRELLSKGFYYIDKTNLITELLSRGGKVNLFTRPRRFGKTLNLSMIRRFFEQELDDEGNTVDNRFIFEGLDISKQAEVCLTHQQQYPVISISLKSARQPDYQLAYEMMQRELEKEYRRHRYVLLGDALERNEKEKFAAIMRHKAARADYVNALEFLSFCLATYHKKNAIILIDEYDVPLENAYFRGFYDQMTDFTRSLFESALKTNRALEFAMITGCLRISRESIFTGLNNLEVHSIMGPGYEDSFGFTEEEVKQLLACYDLEHKYAEVRRWYNGYQFGKKEIYNPWSILTYVKNADLDENTPPKPYWSNTSSNHIIREMVETADFETQREIETLLEGNTIEKPVYPRRSRNSGSENSRKLPSDGGALQEGAKTNRR